MDMYRKALNRNELDDEKEQKNERNNPKEDENDEKEHKNERNDAQIDNPKEDEDVSEQKYAQSDDDEDLDVHEEQSEGGDEEENELRINMEFEMRQEEQIDPVGPLDEALFEAEAADDKVYCVCRKKYSEGDQMIGCEECIEYYHIKCIGITPEEFNFYCESDDAWYCKNCVL
eukprot:685993_1